ncbi:MAG: hypothetical protein J2P25_00395 [Nocardiopsaceae bacterium]|nr:hypothetical protein [Nocardiopsaceae bacterium]
MPELPEAESARAVIERTALGRKIAAPSMCLVHTAPAGQIAAALTGTALTTAHRRRRPGPRNPPRNVRKNRDR